MTKAEIRKMSPVVQLSYGCTFGGRPIYLAPANKNVFMYMCKQKNVPRSRAARLWELYCFVRDGDSIGPDPQSCGMINSHVATFRKSSSKCILQALDELARMRMLYKTETERCLPRAPINK